MVWLPFKVTLACTNFALLCFQIMLMVDHYASNYNLKSWSTVFHALCFGWLSLRGAFWFLTLTASLKWGNSLFYLLYWVPCPLQFGSFSLLPLFFAQILYPKEWRTYWRYVCSIYMAVVVGLTAFMLCWAILRERFDSDCVESGGMSCFYSEYTSYPLRGVTATCFLFLAVTQAAYGLKMAYVHKLQYVRFVISSRRGLAVINVILVLSFLSRGLYQVVSITGGQHIQFPELPLEGQTDVSVLLFAIFMFWDYIPLTLVIMTVTSHTSRVFTLFSLKMRTMSLNGFEATEQEPSYSLPFSYQSINVQSQRHSLAQTQSPRSLMHSLSPGRSLSRNTEESTGQGFSRPSSGDNLKREDFGVTRKPPLSNRQNGLPIGRDDSNFDLTKRFEAPASLTPISSWLSGLGHIPDDPQKYWRSNSPPDKDLLGYGISPIPVPFPCQNQSRMQASSVEAGFAYEDLERAVLQAQKEERKRLELQRVSKRKQELENNDRMRNMAIERENDLVRERERIHQLEMDRQARMQENYNMSNQIHPHSVLQPMPVQVQMSVNERTPLVQLVAVPSQENPVVPQYAMVPQSMLPAPTVYPVSNPTTVQATPTMVRPMPSRRVAETLMLPASSPSHTVLSQHQGQDQRQTVVDSSAIIGTGDGYSHPHGRQAVSVHGSSSRGDGSYAYDDGNEDELCHRADRDRDRPPRDVLQGRNIAALGTEQEHRMRMYNNRQGGELRDLVHPVPMNAVHAPTFVSGSEFTAPVPNPAGNTVGSRGRIQSNLASSVQVAASPVASTRLVPQIRNRVIELQSSRPVLSPAGGGTTLPGTYINQNPCP